MRLSEQEKNAILEAVRHKDPNAIVYIFGSRADVNARGGDIDILILSHKLTFSDKIDIKLAIYDRIGEQKIDIIIDKDLTKPFTRIAARQGLRL